MPTIRIAVAAHMAYWMPSDPLYLPIQAGAAGKESIEGFVRDDSGDNISERNPRYSELSVLYWAWKQLEADYLGLAHYRRHFRGKGERKTLTQAEARSLLERAPVVLPRKRNYYIETVRSHYAHTTDGAHLVALQEVVAELAPDYTDALATHLEQRSTHICNMFIMRRDLADAYCAWLFPILDALDRRIDYASLTPYHARAVGRVAEYLLDVWLEVNGIDYVEVPMRLLGPKQLLRRMCAFMAAKLFGRSYTGTF